MENLYFLRTLLGLASGTLDKQEWLLLATCQFHLAAIDTSVALDTSGPPALPSISNSQVWHHINTRLIERFT